MPDTFKKWYTYVEAALRGSSVGEVILVHRYVEWGIPEYIEENAVFPEGLDLQQVDLIIDLTNLAEDPYIFPTLQILNELDRSPRIYSSLSPALLGPVYHDSSCQCSRAFLTSADHQQILESRSQQRYHQLNSGKIYRKQREIRLMKFRKKKCYYEFLPWPEDYYRWNRPLISTLLIPLLDLCPYSNEVSELLKCCMKQLSLEYSLHRRLRNAVDRYMHRRPDVACRKWLIPQPPINAALLLAL